MEYINIVHIYEDDTDIWSKEVRDAQQITCSGALLNPHTEYSWDVYSHAFCTYYSGDDGYSEALSFAVLGMGASNGPYFFTTGVAMEE